jgi:hypothetical protein
MSERVEDKAEILRQCYHEAGHAICMVLGGIGVKQITIREDASFVDPKSAAGEVYPKLRAALAGGIAQRKYTGKEPEPIHISGDAGSIDRYLEMYKAQNEDPAEWRLKASDDASYLIDKYWEAISILANTLEALPVVNGERKLLGDEFESLIISIIRRLKLQPDPTKTPLQDNV